MKTDCVYCEVQTEILYRMFVKYVLQDAKGFEKNSVIFKKKKKLNAKSLMQKGDFLKMIYMQFFFATYADILLILIGYSSNTRDCTVINPTSDYIIYRKACHY